MGLLDDVLGSAVPGGKTSKPLMLALLALLASGALFGAAARSPPRDTPIRRAFPPARAAVAACSKAWAACSIAFDRPARDKLAAIPGLVRGPIDRYHRAS